MSNSGSDRRVTTRSSIYTSAVVKGRDDSNALWTEDTEILNVSRVGASFYLTREVPAGRLVNIMSKIPQNYRGYDADKQLYRIWGLVQHCRPLTGEEEGNFQIGVAFVGKHVPTSYGEDPKRTYRVTGLDENGFWSVGEMTTQFVSRAYHRFAITLAAKVALVGTDQEEQEVDEEAITENVGAGGVSVYSELDVIIGDAVRFTCDDYDFSSLCVVRNRQIRAGERVSLHLEFAQPDFPVKALAMAADAMEEAEEELEENIEELVEEEVVAAPEPEGDQLLEIEHHSQASEFRELETHEDVHEIEVPDETPDSDESGDTSEDSESELAENETYPEEDVEKEAEMGSAEIDSDEVEALSAEDHTSEDSHDEEPTDGPGGFEIVAEESTPEAEVEEDSMEGQASDETENEEESVDESEEFEDSDERVSPDADLAEASSEDVTEENDSEEGSDETPEES